VIGLAAVDDNSLRPAMPLERLAQESFGGSQVAPLAEPEFDRVTIAVDGPVQILLPPADLDVCFINMPLVSDRALAPVEALQQLR
jgi:hypothetical protein